MTTTTKEVHSEQDYAGESRLAPISDLTVLGEYRAAFQSYLGETSIQPLLIIGEAREVLSHLPDSSVDCAMTSPPYWGKREYANGGIGLELEYCDYIRHLASIFFELKRVLKPEGSFWLNIGDTYKNKNLLGIPWRIAFELTDNQGWIMRNSVIWNKVKSGMDNTKDRLGNVHENVFHFVKQLKYYYNADAVRSKPGDVWDIIPEDTQKRESHFAPYPVDLCLIPILATCREGGIVLDPFCGTGTTLLAARNLGRKSVGIDLSRHYIELTRERCVPLP